MIFINRGYLASALKKIIDDKSLMETGGIKETLAHNQPLKGLIERYLAMATFYREP